MTVYENVALAVDAVNTGASAAERARLTDELIALVNLTPRVTSGRVSCRAACASAWRWRAGSAWRRRFS